MRWPARDGQQNSHKPCIEGGIPGAALGFPVQYIRRVKSGLWVIRNALTCAGTLTPPEMH